MGFVYKLDYEIDTTQSSPKSSQGEREREREGGGGGGLFFSYCFMGWVKEERGLSVMMM
jgi:hypothetical protein